MFGPILAILIAMASPSKEAPAPAAPPQAATPACETPESVTQSLRPGTTLLRDFTGEQAAALSRELSEGSVQADRITAYVNGQLPGMVWLVGFRAGCIVAEGIIRRTDYDHLVGQLSL